MNQDELDRRVKDIAEEAWRIMNTPGPHTTMAEIAARLALVGWEKPDPLLQLARERVASMCEEHNRLNEAKLYREGKLDKDRDGNIRRCLETIRQAYELGKEAAR